MKLKKKKPMIYAQETTQVPSETNQNFTPASYYNMYGTEGREYLPNIFFNIDEEELRQHNIDKGQDESGSYYTTAVGKTLFPGTKGRRINLMSGYENYANLYNQVYNPDEMIGSDYIKNLHQNPGELFSAALEYGNLGKIIPRSNNDRTKGFRYDFKPDELSIGRNDLVNDTKMRNLLIKSRARFDENGNFISLLRSDGTDIKLNDDQKRSIETYVRNRTLQDYVTQGKDKNELRDFRPPEKIETKLPSMIDTEIDSVGTDIKQIDLDKSKEIMEGRWDFSVQPPTKKPVLNPENKVDMKDVSVKGGDQNVGEVIDGGDGDGEGDGVGDSTIENTDDAISTEEREIPSDTEGGFSVGGTDYESEDAARDALKSKPQSQLSDDEYDFLYSYEPKSRTGSNGMKLNKYSKGGKITLKKTKK